MPIFCPIERYAYIRHLPNQFDEILCLTWWETLLYNDQNMALITRWCWWWLGCWCSCSLRAGLGPGTGLGYCLWLSFTQIADPACGNQKFGAQGTQGESLVGQRSYLAFFAGEAASGWGLWLLLGTGQYLGVHGCSHFGPCWCCLYWFAILCSEIAKQLTAVQICKTFLLLFLSSELETILPINCCTTILLLNDLQNWRSFVEKK